jgi:hypothetical protein
VNKNELMALLIEAVVTALTLPDCPEKDYLHDLLATARRDMEVCPLELKAAVVEAKEACAD